MNDVTIVETSFTLPNLPCLFSTFHLEYTSVLPRFCFFIRMLRDITWSHVLFLFFYEKKLLAPLLQNYSMQQIELLLNVSYGHVYLRKSIHFYKLVRNNDVTPVGKSVSSE